MIIKELLLQRIKDNPSTEKMKAALCILNLDDYKEINGEGFLKENDRIILEKVKSPKRIREFSLGRAAAYTALDCFYSGNIPEETSLVRGVFGQPYLKAKTKDVPEISIAHSSGMAAALIFSSGQQLAVDIEELRAQPGRLDAIRSSLVPGEESLIRKTGRGSIEALYTLWTLKEGLGKVLKTGITTPLELFEVSRVEITNRNLMCFYKNFHQYKTLSGTLGDKAVYSIIHPLYTEIKGLEGL